MKKLLFAIISLLAVTVQAQSLFEGTLVYQKKLISSNPDPGESKFISNTETFVCSGKMVRYQIQGGFTDSTDMLLNFATDQYFFLDAAHQREVHMLHKAIPKSTTATIKKLEEKQKILGNSCTKYQITDPTKPQVIFYVWASDQFFQPMKSYKFTFQHDARSQTSMGINLAEMSGLVDGKLVLKIVMDHPQAKSSIVTELTSMVKEKPDPSIFIRPKNYQKIETIEKKTNLLD